MDFKAFLFDLFQDYGAAIYPVAILFGVVMYHKLTKKSRSEQYGFGQSVTLDGNHGVLKNTQETFKDQAAVNAQMDEGESEENASYKRDNEEVDSEDEDALPEIDYESDDFEHGYGIPEDDEELDDCTPNHEHASEGEESEIEVYDDYLDKDNTNKTKQKMSDNHPEESQEAKKAPTKEQESLPELLIMYLVPASSQHFLGYELLQAL